VESVARHSYARSLGKCPLRATAAIGNSAPSGHLADAQPGGEPVYDAKPNHHKDWHSGAERDDRDGIPSYRYREPPELEAG
jgi:hypothetical protein